MEPWKLKSIKKIVNVKKMLKDEYTIYFPIFLYVKIKKKVPNFKTLYEIWLIYFLLLCDWEIFKLILTTMILF